MVSDINKVKEIFNNQNDLDEGEFVSELHYEYTAGSHINFEVDVPEGWEFTIIEINDHRDYDSYGYSVANSAQVVFTVSDGKETTTYSLPGTYASYEGWEWDVDSIVEVHQAIRTQTYWKAV